MSSFFKLPSLFILAIAVLLAGCESTDGPNPDDTLSGSGRMGDDGNWIEPVSVYEDEQGLSPRNAELSGLGPGGIDALGADNTLASVYFGFDQSVIRPQERPKLTQAADFLEQNDAATLIAEGHTDWYGTTEYNVGLSDRRAQSVRTYLVQLGVDPGRVEIRAMGEVEADQGLPKTSPEVVDDRRVDLIVVR